MDDISYLTLAETIMWMDDCIKCGTELDEDFWSNFSDALMYLRIYGDTLYQFMENRKKKIEKKNGD